jgi:hypothetical protein
MDLPTLLRCAALAVSLFATGCSTLERSGGAAPLGLSEGERERLIKSTADLDATQQALTGEESTRRTVRDAYVANRLVLLDADFLAYVRSLTSNKRTLDSASEGSVLGLSVLGTIRDSARAKENLAAAVAAITGLKSNIDKNFFENRGLDAIAAMMVARRKEVLVRIADGVGQSTPAYTLMAARSDLNDYYLAGTMDGAFMTIQAEAARRDATATRDLVIAQASAPVRVATTITAAKRTTKRDLVTALGKATPEAVRKALQALGIPATQPPLRDDEALDVLQRLLFRTTTDADVDRMAEAFEAAGLKK